MMKLIKVIIFLLCVNWANAQQPHRVRHRIRDTVNTELKLPVAISMRSFFIDTLQCDSFFKANFANYLLPKTQLPTNEQDRIAATPKTKYTNRWIFLIVISTIILLLFIKFSFSKLYLNALESFYKRTATADIIHDKYSPRWLFILFSNLFFILVVSLWVSRSFNKPEVFTGVGSLDQFLLIFAIIFLVYFVKFGIHLLSGVLFQITEAMVIYIVNISVTNLVCGILLFFTTLLLLYAPWHEQTLLLNISIGILILFILLRYVRGLLQTIQFFKFNYLYLILYLCTLEIAPWFLIIKYINNYL